MNDCMTTMAAPQLYPTSPLDLLKKQYLGKDLQDPCVAGPQAVVDLAVVRRNCADMLDAVDKLGVSFRAHVKTHKTTEITRLQVGNGPRPVKLVVSTIAEAEHLLPYLLECKMKQGREVNLLYGVPPSRSSVTRLGLLQEALGTESVSFLVDDYTQLVAIRESAELMALPGPIPLFIKVDTGSLRAGLALQSKIFKGLLQVCSSMSRLIRLQGFYCHHGSSYGGSSSDDALESLAHEIETAMAAAAIARETRCIREERLVLSVGATPTVTSVQNLLNPDRKDNPYIMKLIGNVQEHDDLELHAGVYPFLDLQQLATHARPSTRMNSSDIGLRILVEVLSYYSDRPKVEALIGAGSLALGREPCKSYPGWGIVAPSAWKDSAQHVIYTDEDRQGWIVGRISQEHGILTWEGGGELVDPLATGQKLLVWPNHACIAAAGYGWYLVVDSDREDVESSTIVDVWTRWRGW